MSVSLASPDGRVVGGGVAGLLVAASPVQVWLILFPNFYPCPGVQNFSTNLDHFAPKKKDKLVMSCFLITRNRDLRFLP